MKRTISIDITADIDRGFVISKEKNQDRVNAFWKWCEQNKRILVEVKIKRSQVICEIDVYPLRASGSFFRFSDTQLEELYSLAVKHHARKGSDVATIFSKLNFATEEEALAFAADVVEWLKTVEIKEGETK